VSPTQLLWLTCFFTGRTNEPVTRVIRHGRVPGDAGYSERQPLMHWYPQLHVLVNSAMVY
jgi:hypothetical protein